MPPPTPRYPDLHTIPRDSSHPPELLASRCAGCGHLAFPARRFGCPSCGAEAESARSAPLPGRGTLEVFTVVHRPLGAGPEPPYAVGSIRLEAGIEVDAILAVDDLARLRPGQRMEACLVETGQDETGTPLVECRFRPEGPR